MIEVFHNYDQLGHDLNSICTDVALSVLLVSLSHLVVTLLHIDICVPCNFINC